MPSKNARLQQWVNYRVRVCLQVQCEILNVVLHGGRSLVTDSRMMVGSFLAFDRHMNVVLADTEEFRKLKIRHKLPDGKHLTEEKEIKRSVGLVMIRGENVLTLTAEAPPPAKPKPVAGPVAPGPGGAPAPVGRGIPAGRGVPLAAAAAPAALGLVGPVRGVGGPAPQEMVMMPHQIHAPMPMMMMVPPAAAAAAGGAAAAARSAAAAAALGGAPPGTAAGIPHAGAPGGGLPHPAAGGISNSCGPAPHQQQQPPAGMIPGPMMGAHPMGLPRPQ